MSKEIKEKLFEKMLYLEHMAEEEPSERSEWKDQSLGAYRMLAAIGLESEYIHWAIGK